jgi:hypothetical protein
MNKKQRLIENLRYKIMKKLNEDMEGGDPHWNEYFRREEDTHRKIAYIQKRMERRTGPHLASPGVPINAQGEPIGSPKDSRHVTSINHKGSWTPYGFDDPIHSRDIVVTSTLTPEGKVNVELRTNIINPTRTKIYEPQEHTYHLANAVVHPNNDIQIIPRTTEHIDDIHSQGGRVGDMNDSTVERIVRNHLEAGIGEFKNHTTNEMPTVAQFHGLADL